MANATTAVTGPDLTVGIPLASLSEGVPLVGHVDGEAVLLVLRGAEVFAVAATCTHYSGPLAEGIIVGEEIRCPWHHACFSLRTGAVLSPPALNPLACWDTEVRGDVVVVTRRRDAHVSVRPLHTRSPDRVVIVGGGAAGSMAAETLRNEGYERDVVVLDPDDGSPCDRPNLSKDYLAGNAPEEWLPLRPAAYYEERGIRRISRAAVGIDAAQKLVTLDGGDVLPFDSLVLATGAEPLRPRIDGAQLPHVHVLRTLADCRALIAASAAARHVVIAGASFIGLEVAASLRARGLDVTVVAPEAVPFAKVLGPKIGMFLRHVHEEHGVHFVSGRMLGSISAERVYLDDGSSIACDVVVLGIGVRPRLDLADGLGLDARGGVPVDEYLESSIRGVFAAGDIARYTDVRTGEQLRIEHWVVAQRQGRAAALNVLGARTPYRAVPFFWTQQYDVSVSYVGHAGDWTHINFDGSAEQRNCAAAFMNGDRLLAYATIGRDIDSLDAEWGLENWEP